MKTAINPMTSWLMRMIFILVGFFVFQNSIFAISSQIEFSFEVVHYQDSPEFNDDFADQFFECHFSDLHTSIPRVLEPENANIKGAVNLAAKGSSKILNFTTKQLQAKFKHAADFGVKGNWNKAAAGKFNSAINQHINSSGVRAIQGTYRGNPVTHYLNPNTGLNVISGPNGQFISGWKLNPGQLQNVLKHGGL